MNDLYLRHALFITLFAVSMNVFSQDPYPTYDERDTDIVGYQEIGSTNPVGSIIAVAGESKPTGYLFCNGDVLQIDDYPELFKAIGTRYGGDGVATFYLPDLRGRFLRGFTAQSSEDIDRYNAGQGVGTYQADENKSHSHGMQSTGSHSHSVSGVAKEGGSNAGPSGSGVNDAVPTTAYTNSTGNHTHTIYDTGGAESRPKNVSVIFYIKASSHEQISGKYISGNLNGDRSAFVDYENTKGIFVNSGNDNAFFGLKNRNGEDGGIDDYNAVIYFGNNDADHLVFESQDYGEILTLKPEGVLINENIQVKKDRVDADGVGNTRAPLLLTDQDAVRIESDSIQIGAYPSDILTLRSGRLNILSDIYGKENVTTGKSSINFKDAVYVESAEGLVVNSLIKTQDIDITPGAAPAAPDYVFLEDYDLMSLEAVNEYIIANGHLPEVPSAEEFAQNGYSVNEMDYTLLKKVEELTLHLIEMQAEKKQLEKENESLKSGIRMIEDRLSRIEEEIR